MLRRLAAAVLAVTALVAPESSRAAAPEVVKREQLTPRMAEYTLRTDALAAETKVRVLLPAGYDGDAGRRYPVLYLLHGCCDDWRSWADKGDVAKITEGKPLIVVMPDGGRAGFYTDWFNNGAGGPPRWETYHVGQLIPWVEQTFRTVARREGRAVAGLSMGGFGAMTYAARHPDLFVAAASFSGAVDVVDPTGAAVDAIALQEGARPGSVFGPRATEEVRWRARNPVDLAENLRSLRLTLRTGNGRPGGPYGGGPDLLEIGVHRQSTNLHERLAALRVAHVWDDYGAGAHTWPYWQRALRQTLPQILDAFASPPAPPARVTHVAAESVYEVFGWRVAIERPALEFSRLADASPAGFVLAGSGSATVLTPPSFRAGETYRVRTSGAGEQAVTASPDGRLKIAVGLGPGNPDQQHTAQARARGTKVVTRAVTIGAQPGTLPPAPKAPRPACTSRRSVLVHPRVPRSARALTVLVDGRVVRRQRTRRPVRVALTGRPRSTVTVRIVATTRGGRRHVDTRRYRTCTRRAG